MCICIPGLSLLHTKQRELGMSEYWPWYLLIFPRTLETFYESSFLEPARTRLFVLVFCPYFTHKVCSVKWSPIKAHSSRCVALRSLPVHMPGDFAGSLVLRVLCQRWTSHLDCSLWQPDCFVDFFVKGVMRISRSGALSQLISSHPLLWRHN